MIFLKAIKYFIHLKPEIKYRPRQYIHDDYDVRDATKDELLIMKAVRARSPEEARRLMAEFGVDNAVDLLAQMPDLKPSIWQRIKSRFSSLVMRVEGSSVQNPVYIKSRAKDIDLEIHWKKQNPS